MSYDFGRRFDSQQYFDYMRCVVYDSCFDNFKGKSVLILGATGLLGSLLVDCLMYCNRTRNFETKIYAYSRNKAKAESIFQVYRFDSLFNYRCCDIISGIDVSGIESIDYCLNFAGDTHPSLYAAMPIDVILGQIVGNKNFLDVAFDLKAKRSIYVSSNEIYGDNQTDVIAAKEDFCGYIDCNTFRACYNESKRCAESLCQAYRKSKGLDVVIVRPCRLYGPGLANDDSKALSQFIRNAINGQDIELISDGSPYYSFLDSASTLRGIVCALFYGEDGEAYNISNSKSDATLKEVAELIGGILDVKVKFNVVKEDTNSYSKAKVAISDSSKLASLGWVCCFNLKLGLKEVISILKDMGWGT